MIARAYWSLKRLPFRLHHAIDAARQRRIAWKRFWASFHAYRHTAPSERKPPLDLLYPCPGEDVGVIDIEPIYYYQDAWAFERIVERRPARHLDIASHHKFVALLSKVIPVTTVDIRPPSLPLDTLEFQQGSILALPFRDGSISSLSSLCVVEHVGLGRYGDALDPFGTEKAVSELKRIVAPGGDLYLSVPLHNENRTYFNAHRTFTEPYFLSLCEPFEVVDRRYIFGREFGSELRRGFGTGCYHLRRR
jgi:SAM-dependent methyltransferase